MKKFKKKNNKLIPLLIICILLTPFIASMHNKSEATTTEIQTFAPTETIEEFESPDMGFYKPTPMSLKAEGEWNNVYIERANGLVHLRLGQKSFTKKANGVKD